MPKFFKHWVPPFTGWLYDQNDARVNLAQLIGNINGTSVSSDLEGIGDIDVGLSQIEIVISGTPAEIRIMADPDNTGIIFIGKTGILSDGSNDYCRLWPGDEVFIAYNDTTNALYAISDTASQKINVGAKL